MEDFEFIIGYFEILYIISESTEIKTQNNEIYNSIHEEIRWSSFTYNFN